jgi:polyisoprenoid-binding protein YceI
MTTITTPPEETLSGSYSIDEAHSRIGFVARHAMITKVRGSFNEFTGTGVLDIDNPEKSSVELTIKVTSIDTRNQMRDEHLRSNDFLDLATFPEIHFVSTSVHALDGPTFRGLSVVGDLTIKGVTKEVSFDADYTGAAVDPYGNHRIGFEGTTTLNRSDFGVSYNGVLEAGGVLISEAITLEFEISAIKAA